MTDFDSWLESASVGAHWFKDDGAIPNNPELPLLVYRRATTLADDDPATVFEALFTANGWPAAWRNGIHPFHHFHSTAHEALGVYRGTATARFGGEGGIDLRFPRATSSSFRPGSDTRRSTRARTSASSARTRPGPAPISAAEPRENGRRASTPSPTSRFPPATPSTAPKVPSAVTGPEPFRTADRRERLPRTEREPDEHRDDAERYDHPDDGADPRGSRRMDRKVDHLSREPEPPASERPVVAASRVLGRDEGRRRRRRQAPSRGSSRVSAGVA